MAVMQPLIKTFLKSGSSTPLIHFFPKLLYSHYNRYYLNEQLRYIFEKYYIQHRKNILFNSAIALRILLSIFLLHGSSAL